MTVEPDGDSGPAAKERGRIVTWLRRGKLWDDVFTRTVAALITAVILALFALAAGLIHFDARAWRTLGIVVLALLAGAVLAIDDYLRHSTRRSEHWRDQYRIVRRSVFTFVFVAGFLIWKFVLHGG